MQIAPYASNWAAVADVSLGSMISYIGSKASKIINFTFQYDLQKTRGLVYLKGGTVAVTAYRYANYTGKVYLGGQTVTKNTKKCGGWWSSSKPFDLSYEK